METGAEVIRLAIKTQPFFGLGKTVSTRGALQLMQELSIEPVDLLSRGMFTEIGATWTNGIEARTTLR
jgi:hypothetical protein